ncbi:hypothetical protein [Glutamicibacter sp. NPDC087344]|uniref:hypothetical protein n=1 Tax=Glutamicibacter sp. NPDC087344 TaxID=3363994 RepID=UPI0037F7B36D
MTNTENTQDADELLPIIGSTRTLNLTRGQHKALISKLSLAYAESLGDRESMVRILEDLAARMQITDRVAFNELQARTVDAIERAYAADPDIASASLATSRNAFYLLRHRQLERAWVTV